MSGATVHQFSVRHPALTIWRDAPSRVVVGWPVAASCYELQYSDTATGITGWTAEGSAPALVGDRWVVTNTITGTARFYRLKR